MKISLILPDLRGGGAERVMLDLAHEFARLGLDAEFVVMQGRGAFLDEARRDFSVVDLGARRVRGVAWPLARYLRRHRPEALIAAMWPLTVAAPVAARLAGFRGRVLVSEHAILSKQYAQRGRMHRLALKASTSLGYRLATSRVGVSRGTCDDMAALASMSSNKFVTVYNPIRPATRPTASRLRSAEAMWGGEGRRILNVGTFKPVKNHELLLRAFAQVPHMDARLMLVGKGQNESALCVLAADLGIADRVIFAGFHSDPSHFYATADLFVLSSDHEGFGNVIVEALSYGLTVVSTNCPAGPAEILEKGRFGRLVPVGNPDALSKAIQDALASPDERTALIRRAMDFTPGIAAQKYLEVMGLK